MQAEADRIGPATLARYAELVHEGLGEMRGATAPRLLLEVTCARMLLPSASDAESAALQRIERLERRLDVTRPTDERAADPAPVRRREPEPPVREPGRGRAAAGREERRPPHPNRRCVEPRADARAPLEASVPEPPRAETLSPTARRASPNQTTGGHATAPPELEPPPEPQPEPGFPASPTPPRCARCGPRCWRRCASAAGPSR